MIFMAVVILLFKVHSEVRDVAITRLECGKGADIGMLDLEFSYTAHLNDTYTGFTNSMTYLPTRQRSQVIIIGSGLHYSLETLPTANPGEWRVILLALDEQGRHFAEATKTVTCPTAQ